jgi:hypothetical protein
MVNSCEPVIDLVRQLLAEIESAPGLVEDETIPTTWTTQVATVIYGQSQMSDLCWRLVGPLVELQVGTLVLIAVTVGAVCYTGLQMCPHIACQQFIHGLDLQVADALW